VTPPRRKAPAPLRLWEGFKVVLTSGPTREHLDPIRYLTNGSSGAMGAALADAARARGAAVTLVAGPGSVRPSLPGIRVVDVVTALEMHRAALSAARGALLFIGAAAVGDWRFAEPSRAKIKKSVAIKTVELVPNPDIIADLGKVPGAPLRIGFALETGAWLSLAAAKLRRKGLDMIVANKPDSMGGGKARLALLRPGRKPRLLPRLPKPAAAARILDEIERLMHDRAARILEAP